VLLLVLTLTLAACNLQQGPPTPVPTPDAPRVEFRFPPSNTTIVEGSELTIELLAVDSGSGVARAALLVDDTIHQEGKPTTFTAVPTFTVTMNWLAQGIGRHSLAAVAYRIDGTASPIATIIIEVLPKTGGT
jgi:hypothetical protein